MPSYLLTAASTSNPVLSCYPRCIDYRHLRACSGSDNFLSAHVEVTASLIANLHQHLQVFSRLVRHVTSFTILQAAAIVTGKPTLNCSSGGVAKQMF
jgi:hypothetical protein